MSFAHLHVHSEFSMLDGAARVNDLVRAVAADGQPGVAITDHGVLFGAVEFQEEAKKMGVKPIIGCELYLAPEGRREARRIGEVHAPPFVRGTELGCETPSLRGIPALRYQGESAYTAKSTPSGSTSRLSRRERSAGSGMMPSGKRDGSRRRP